MILLMKLLAPPLMLIAAAATAQPAPTVAPVPAAPAVWNPVAPYITAGQDEPGYRSWYLAAPWRAAQVKTFNDYLNSAQVGGVLPTWQLLRTATSWADCRNDIIVNVAECLDHVRPFFCRRHLERLAAALLPGRRSPK